MDRRERLSKLAVLIADRDQRTASLVQRIMYSFGFRNMDITTNGESVLELLRARHYDIIITEWNMEPLDGLGLVKAIRTAQDDERIHRDIPIIMLTARADLNSVQDARDAGITEFVAKPFSAKTISNRIIQIIDNPRTFIEAGDFIGPDRRRREPPPDIECRRVSEAATLPPDDRLRRHLGELNAADIIDEIVVAEAQTDLLKAEDDFIDWARADILRLRRAFNVLQHEHDNMNAARDLVDSAYAIQAQSGIFGYQLGTEVAQLLISYLNNRSSGFNADNLLVVSKYIDTIATIFKERMKESGQGIAREMLFSLRQLTQKLG